MWKINRTLSIDEVIRKNKIPKNPKYNHLEYFWRLEK